VEGYWKWNGSEMWIMVEPVAEILFGICWSLMQCYGYNKEPGLHPLSSTLHSPTCPIGLRSDCLDSTRSPSGVQSDSVCSTGLYFEVYFPSGVQVESEWSPSGLIHSMLFKQFESHYSVVTSVRSDSTRIGLGLTT
jgi:hypothetical protein